MRRIMFLGTTIIVNYKIVPKSAFLTSLISNMNRSQKTVNHFNRVLCICSTHRHARYNSRSCIFTHFSDASYVIV